MEVTDASNGNGDHLVAFVSGLVGGCAGLVFGHPFDTVKVRQHIYSSSGCGLMRAIHLTTVHDGLLGFYKGMGFPLASVGFLNSLFFGVYDNMRTFLASRHQGTSRDVRFTSADIGMAAAFGGAVQALPAASIELVKVKLQAQTNSGSERRFRTHYAGAFDCLRSIYHQHGLRGTFHGLGSTITRDVPGFAVYMLVYENICYCLSTRSATGSSSSGGGGSGSGASGGGANVGGGGGGGGGGGEGLGVVASFWAGGTAGVASWMVNIPIDVMKSRIQADDLGRPRYRNLADCAVKSYRRDGLIVFWRGLGVTCMRAFPLNAVTLTVYTTMMELLKGLRRHQGTGQNQ